MILKWLIEKALVDKRNRELWDRVNSSFKVNYKVDFRKYAEVKNVGQDFPILSLGIHSFNSSSLTHELLHLDLELNGYDFPFQFRHYLPDYEYLSTVFDQILICHISNILDHNIMLPRFLKLGYSREYFLSDYNTVFVSLDYLENLKESKNLNTSNFFNNYIGKLISVLGSPNTVTDYSEVLNKFEDIEPKLFGGIKDFWDKFNYHLIYDNDIQLINILIDKLLESLNEVIKNQS